ncbi:MAG: hypothetical protein WD512_17710, partial [Candidatus Paceibacterota bacterium]
MDQIEDIFSNMTIGSNLPDVDESTLPIVGETKSPVSVKKKIIFKKKNVSVNTPPINFVYDTWIPWSEKSAKILFEVKNEKGVGNGERKLGHELDCVNTIGGQNSLYDLKHPFLGTISVKDMTKDGCI